MSILRKIGIMLGLVAASSASAIEPPVDLNKPVENPALVAAILKHQKVGSNETATELFEALKISVFLVGMITDKPIENEGGYATFKKGDHLGLITVLDNSDKSLLGLFTDHAELQKFTNQATSTLVMPTKMALEATLQHGYSGVVINPAGQASLRLDKEFIITIMEQFQ
ncbi:SseB family protein [Shewanella sp. AS16]|uniref:SseB family protein n=1 Tax=Shewanella sp. AS16 TaxID=2907625 RepID=UPI001F484A3D|nr:SseB family protein [Shewanella sp. AS16]MCE9687170.1 SseB family protein [Shewanella sp. AS16]